MLNTRQTDSTDISIYIGSYLKHRRKAVGLTGAQLASRLNISQQQVSRYERGKNSITIQFLMEILQALELQKNDVDNFMQKILQFYYTDAALDVKLFN
ncbi:TPA: helix-turn-helix domain-containing protein [Providencia rettgeri]